MLGVQADHLLAGFQHVAQQELEQVGLALAGIAQDRGAAAGLVVILLIQVHEHIGAIFLMADVESVGVGFPGIADGKEVGNAGGGKDPLRKAPQDIPAGGIGGLESLELTEKQGISQQPAPAEHGRDCAFQGKEILHALCDQFNEHGAIHECLPVIALLEQHAAYIFQCGLRHHALLHFRGAQFHPIFIAAGLNDGVLLAVRQFSGRQADIDAAHLAEAIQKGQVLRGGRVTFQSHSAAVGIAENVIIGIEPDRCRGDHIQEILLPRRRTFRRSLSFLPLFFLSHASSPPVLHPHLPPQLLPRRSGSTPTTGA